MSSTGVVISLTAFVVIGIALLYLSDKTEECSSLLGTFVRLLSPETQQKCEKVGAYFYYLSIAWVFSGIYATGYIGIMIFQKNKVAGISYSIFMTVLILRLSGVV